MCGIIGYIGSKQADIILINGLKRLEYRGYDSSGLAVFDRQRLQRYRSVGNIQSLIQKLQSTHLPGTIGIAHTRWATHGGVTENNAHPHVDCHGRIVLVHNGIIENYRELKERLSSHTFSSETDSEVLAHLIESYYDGDLQKAVLRALAEVRGTYGLVVMHQDHPNTLIAARLGSPLALGIGEGEYYIASDATPILPYTKKVIFLDDGEIAKLTRERVDIFSLDQKTIEKRAQEIQWSDEQAEKQGFAHFMLKEIFDQPTVFQDALRGRIHMEDGTARLGGINMTDDEIRKIQRIVLLGCGTASYAGMIGKFAFERFAGIPCEVDVGSEFRYRDPILDENTLVFAISQSGETADTLAAMREAKRKGAKVRGIVNVIGSTIAREAGAGTYIHAGPELAVASTKAYTNMVAILLLYAIEFGRMKKVTVSTGQKLLNSLLCISGQMKNILDQNNAIESFAKRYKQYQNFFFLGRGITYPVALEGSLKLKETSYIHAEAYPAGELKHGPIALISSSFPVVALVLKNQLYEKMRSNIEEIRARGAKILLIGTEGDEGLKELSQDIIFIPNTMELLQPLLATLPLQLFAYHMASLLGKNVDRPRNLAKSVTVE